ncbi:hypothetical protein [Roseicitreum antarcticum]|uniref:Uncharacterized protein n=1 Tax=Roseicitreum antarcticum TaxID=564137 RepID=A0A1H2XYP7_9RHOB|nr:hypothetical protein [Roseicitreum antarcticum]SDW97449.1 hypothetical protein SAMN04488238_104340 [Roseicitreum antarcticum]
MTIRPAPFHLALPLLLSALLSACAGDPLPPRDSRANIPAPGLAPIDAVLAGVPPVAAQTQANAAQSARANALRARAARLRALDLDQL